MSKKKKLFTLFLALTVVFTMCFAAVPAYAASGTAITNADDLKAMSANGNYYLANDIEVPANLILFTSYDAHRHLGRQRSHDQRLYLHRKRRLD